MDLKIVNIHNDDYTVYCGRGSIFGNPYKIGVDGNRNEVCDKYENYFHHRIKNDLEFKEVVENIKDDDILGCFCKPKRCHVQTIVNYLTEIDEW